MNRRARLTIQVTLALLLLIAGYVLWTNLNERQNAGSAERSDQAVPTAVNLFKTERGYLKYLPRRLELAKRGDEDQICTLLADATLCSNVYDALASNEWERKKRTLSPAALSKMAKLYLRGDLNQSFAYCRNVGREPLDRNERAALINAASMSQNQSVRTFAALYRFDQEFPDHRYRKLIVEAMHAGDFRAVSRVISSDQGHDGKPSDPGFTRLDRAIAYQLLMETDGLTMAALPQSAQALLRTLSPAETKAAEDRVEWITENTDIVTQSARSGGPDYLAFRQRLDCPALENGP